MEPKPIDHVWITLIVVANVFWFARKAILAKHGFGFSFMDLQLQDGKRLRELTEKESDPRRRRLLQVINRGFPVSFVLAIVIMVLSRAL